MARSVPFSLQPPPHDVDARAAATAATSRALRAALAASLRSACSGFARASARLAVRRCAHRLCTVLRTSASATAPTSAHCRSLACSRHSCGRSCGARPHFVRHCLAQCAPHRRPLNRRGGSDPPASPASIFRSFIQRESPIRPAGPALGSTPHASMMPACHGAPCPAFSAPFGVNRGRAIVGPSVCRSETRGSSSPCPCTAPPVMPRNSRMPGAKHERNTSDMRVLRPGRHDWHPLSVNETRAQCAGFWDVRPGCARPGARPAQSGASPRSDSWNARASATSASSSFWRPSRSIASRLSVARNQV